VAGSFRIAEGYVEVTADESSYDRSIARLQGKKLTVGISPKMDDASFQRVTKALDRLTKDRMVRILASADTRVAADEIANLARRQRVRIGVDVDTRVAADDIANLTRRRIVRVAAQADTGEARTRLDALARDRHVNLNVDVDRGAASRLSGMFSGVGGGLSTITSALTSMTSLAIGALPTLASLAQSVIAMGPAAALAAPAVLSLGAAFAAVKIGTSGIGDAFKAAFAPAASSAASARSALNQVANAERAVAKAQQGVKDAEVAAAAARVKAARDIRDSQLALKNTVSDVADANRRAAESVANAERDLADAQKASKQAQEDLTAARKDAARQLEDLANQQKDAELDRREGVLRVQDAQTALNKVMADPTATQQQRDEALLTYDQAVQSLNEIELRQKRLAADAAAANKAGVEGSDQVKQAKEGVANATQDIADKTQALKDQEIEASRTQVDGAQRVAKAERDVADARAAAAKAAVDGARQVADAQAQVADAARALADAQTSADTGVNKLSDSLAALSPNARAFVQAVIDQGAAWRGLKLDVQDALFAGLAGKFQTMTTAVLPSLRTGLTGTAGVLNAMAKNAADAVTELGKTGMLKKLFDGLNNGLKPLSRVPGQFIKGLAQISVAASPAFKRLTTQAGGFADRISKQLDKAFKNGHLEKIIDQAVGIAKQFAGLIGDIFGTLGNVMKAAADGGGNALGTLGEVFKELRRITGMPEVQKMLSTIFKAVNDVAKLLAGALGAAIQAVLPVLAALAPVVSTLAKQLGPVVAKLFKALGDALLPIAEKLGPVLAMVGDLLVGLVSAVVPLLKPIGDLITAIIDATAPVMKQVVGTLVQLATALAGPLTDVIAALVPMIGPVLRIMTALSMAFLPLMPSLMKLLPPIGELTVSLLSLVTAVLTPMLPLIQLWAKVLTTELGFAISLLVPVISTVIGWLSKLVDGVTWIVNEIVKAFQWLYDTLVGHSIIPDLVNAIIKWFTNLWTGTKKIFTDLKNWVVDLWNRLWTGVRTRWDAFWTGLRSAVSGAWSSLKNSVSSLRTSLTGVWSAMWTSIRDKATAVFTTIRGKVADFKNAMKSAFSSLRDALGSIWKGIQSKFSAPVKWVIGNVYNDGIRKMWNTIASKISSKITLPAIKLGFNSGGVVPGSGNRDTVPAMLTPGERILSKQQVAQFGGHRGIDAMLGKDHPTGTGGNPTRQQERTRQGHQAFASGGIVGTITDLGKKAASAVGGGLDWAKNLVVGGLQAAARKAIESLVRPLINSIPGGGVGSLLKGLSNKALSGMLGFLGGEDKKAGGGPAVQKALSWARTQDGKPYQWGGNNNPSFDCSGFMSAIESVIRGEKPHRRWATGSFSGSSGPAGWVRNLSSPFQIGITNAGVGHTAGTIAGVNVESRGGAGVIVGKGARGYNDPLFQTHWGFKPATKFDSGGLLAPGATLAANATGRPERVLSAEHTARLDALLNQAATMSGGVTVNMTVNCLTMPTPAERKQFAVGMAGDINEALRNWNRRRA
jgi:phage-related protein